DAFKRAQRPGEIGRLRGEPARGGGGARDYRAERLIQFVRDRGAEHAQSRRGVAARRRNIPGAPHARAQVEPSGGGWQRWSEDHVPGRRFPEARELGEAIAAFRSKKRRQAIEKAPQG